MYIWSHEGKPLHEHKYGPSLVHSQPHSTTQHIIQHNNHYHSNRNAKKTTHPSHSKISTTTQSTSAWLRSRAMLPDPVGSHPRSSSRLGCPRIGTPLYLIQHAPRSTRTLAARLSLTCLQMPMHGSVVPYEMTRNGTPLSHCIRDMTKGGEPIGSVSRLAVMTTWRAMIW